MRIGIRIGEPLDFSRYEGMEDDRFVLRSITDEIMYELMQLSGQEYVDVYAATMKERLAAAKSGAPSRARVTPRTRTSRNRSLSLGTSRTATRPQARPGRRAAARARRGRSAPAAAASRSWRCPPIRRAERRDCRRRRRPRARAGRAGPRTSSAVSPVREKRRLVRLAEVEVVHLDQPVQLADRVGRGLVDPQVELRVVTAVAGAGPHDEQRGALPATAVTACRFRRAALRQPPSQGRRDSRPRPLHGRDDLLAHQDVALTA